MSKIVRVGAGQGFWGDDIDAPRRQVEGGQLDYLMLDYLAEVTMSIMQKQRSRNPELGYATDFVPLMERILPACVERNIRVIANAGGVNPAGCSRAVLDVARRLGLAGRVSVGIVHGDDVMDRLDEFLERGIELRNMDTGEPLSTVRPRTVRWLWEPYLPRGKLALLDGDPGLGKSLVTLDLCARLSTGRPWPDGSAGPGPANSLVLNGEDDAAERVPPPQIAHGAEHEVNGCVGVRLQLERDRHASTIAHDRGCVVGTTSLPEEVVGHPGA